MTFGIFALRDNDAVYQIIVSPNNNVTYDPEIISSVDAQRAEYFIDGLPASTAITVSVQDANLSSGGGETFTIDNYTDNGAMSDGAGEATVYVGATLSTSGNTTLYSNGNHTDDVNITFTW